MKGGGFAAPQNQLDRAGGILHLGQFWSNETEKWDAVVDSKYAQELSIGVDAVDWEGDGRFDLVSGSGLGGVWWLSNVGLAGGPAFEEPRALVDPDPIDRGPLRDPRWLGRGT